MSSPWTKQTEENYKKCSACYKLKREDEKTERQLTEQEEHEALLLLGHLRGESEACTEVVAGVHGDLEVEHLEYCVLHDYQGLDVEAVVGEKHEVLDSRSLSISRQVIRKCDEVNSKQ